MSDIGQSLKSNILQGILSGFQQPTAQLGETQAAAGAAGASAGLSNQSRVNEQLQQPLRQAQADQIGVIQQAGSDFEKNADKQGYVSPQLYNNYLAQYVQKGGDATDFDGKFQDSYVNPKNAFYDTPDAKAARSALPIIKQIIDSYNKLHVTGQVVKDAENIPVVGPYIKQNYLSAQSAHDTFLTGEIGNIRQIAGAGAGQGFRFNLNELNNIAGLLPSSSDNRATANQKLDQLDTFLQNNMGVGLKTLIKK